MVTAAGAAFSMRRISNSVCLASKAVDLATHCRPDHRQSVGRLVRAMHERIGDGIGVIVARARRVALHDLPRSRRTGVTSVFVQFVAT